MKPETAMSLAECARIIRETGVIPFVAGAVAMAAVTMLVVLVSRYLAST